MPITKTFITPLKCGHISERSKTSANWTTTTNQLRSLPTETRSAVFVFDPNTAPFDGVSRIYKVTLFFYVTIVGFITEEQWRISQLKQKGSLLVNPTWNAYDGIQSFLWGTSGGDPVITKQTTVIFPQTTGYISADLTKLLSCPNHFVNQGDLSFIIQPYIPNTGGLTTFYSDNSTLNKPYLVVTYTPAKPRLRSRRRQFSRRSRY